MAFERLIRFVDETDKVQYGNLAEELPTKQIAGSVVEVVEGSVESGFSKTGKTAKVKSVSPSSCQIILQKKDS